MWTSLNEGGGRWTRMEKEDQLGEFKEAVRSAGAQTEPTECSLQTSRIYLLKLCLPTLQRSLVEFYLNQPRPGTAEQFSCL